MCVPWPPSLATQLGSVRSPAEHSVGCCVLGDSGLRRSCGSLSSPHRSLKTILRAFAFKVPPTSSRPHVHVCSRGRPTKAVRLPPRITQDLVGGQQCWQTVDRQEGEERERDEKAGSGEEEPPLPYLNFFVQEIKHPGHPLILPAVRVDPGTSFQQPGQRPPFTGRKQGAQGLRWLSVCLGFRS